MFENLNNPNMDCPKCGIELQMVYATSKGELALVVTDYAFCPECKKFYKITVQTIE